MADQAITALPKKTYSGSSKIAATDYLLGIDSAEGYQMLIQDLGEYIINRVTASLAGSNQTLAAAISALNSNMTAVPVAKYYRVTMNQDFNTLPVGFALAAAGAELHSPESSGMFYVHSYAYTINSDGTIAIGYQVANTYNVESYNQYYRKCQNGTWSAWEQVPTRTEMDALDARVTSLENS